MKGIFKLLVAVAAVAICVDASAQQVVKKRIGAYKESGNVVVAEATSTLAVDVVVEHEVFTPGVYARYAQKLLGTRASLVEREEYRVVSADVALIVDGVTKIGRLNFSTKEEQQAESLRKMLIAMGKDIRVIIEYRCHALADSELAGCGSLIISYTLSDDRCLSGVYIILVRKCIIISLL